MKPLRKLFSALSSREFLLWMVGLWVIYYVTSAVWTKEAFSRFVVSLSVNIPLMAGFVLFILSFALNIVRSVRQHSKKGVWAAVLGAVLPIGLLLFFTGFFISASFRQSETRLVGEGDEFRPRWVREPLTVVSISPALKDETLESTLERTVFRYEPKITLSVQDGDEREVGAFPPVVIGDTYYHILNFGLAPGVRLFKEGKVLDEGYMPMRIIPPGVVDRFQIEPYPYRFTLRIAPRRIVERGGRRVKLYDLKDLAYEVEVRKGEELLFSGNSAGSPEGVGSVGGVRFDGHRLTFFKPANWVVVEMVKDRGRAVMIAGIALVLAGLPMWAVSLAMRLRRG